MGERLTEAQREAILDVAAFADSQDSVILAWCNTTHHVPVTDAQVLRALRVIAHLDALDEEQLGHLIRNAMGHEDAATHPLSKAAFSALVAALEAADG